jgi:CheY-like chemotaxis protein
MSSTASESLARELQRLDCRMSLRILVADDDADLLEVVVEALTDAGANVASAKSGAELLKRLGEDGAFDLIIADVLMPWMTGLQVASSVREAGLEVPVILMTGTRDSTLDERVDSLDRTVLLRKPFGDRELRAAVQKLLPGAI